MSLTRFLRRTQGTRGQIREAGGFGAVSLIGRGGRAEYVPSIGKGLLLNMPLRKDTRMIYSAGGADGFSTETVDADGTYIARTAIGGLLTGATANTARIEDDGVLVEGTRTNLCLQSEDFGTTWVATSSLVLANNAVAPDGAETGTFIVDLGVGSKITQALAGGVLTDDLQYTFSVFVKYASASTFTLTLQDTDAPADRARADFEWSASVVTVKGADVGTAGVTAISSGWYRVWITCPASVIVGANAHSLIFYVPEDGAGATYTGIYAWGAQAEAGAAMSSYIPTTTASVERAADVLEVASSGHFLPAAGTLFLAITPNSLTGTYYFSNYASSDGIYARLSAGTPTFYVKTANVIVASLSATSALTVGQTAVLAHVWDTDDVRLYVDGGDEKSDTSATMPASLTAAVKIGSLLTTNFMDGTISHLLIYSDAKSAADIATISAEIAEWMT